MKLLFIFLILFAFNAHSSEPPKVLSELATRYKNDTAKTPPRFSLMVMLGNTRTPELFLRSLPKQVGISFVHTAPHEPSLIQMAQNNGHNLYVTTALSTSDTYTEFLEKTYSPWKEILPGKLRGLVLNHGYGGQENALKTLLAYLKKESFPLVSPERQAPLLERCRDQQVPCLIGDFYILPSDTTQQMKDKFDQAVKTAEAQGYVHLTVSPSTDGTLALIQEWLETLTKKAIPLVPLEEIMYDAK